MNMQEKVAEAIKEASKAGAIAIGTGLGVVGGVPLVQHAMGKGKTDSNLRKNQSYKKEQTEKNDFVRTLSSRIKGFPKPKD